MLMVVWLWLEQGEVTTQKPLPPLPCYLTEVVFEIGIYAPSQKL